MKRTFFVTLALVAALFVPVAQADFVAPPPPGGGGAPPPASGGKGGNLGGGHHHSSLSWAGPAMVVEYAACIYYNSQMRRPGPDADEDVLLCHPLLFPLAVMKMFVGGEASYHHPAARKHRTYRKYAKH